MRWDYQKYLDQWISALVEKYDIELAWAALIVFILSIGTVMMLASTCLALIIIPYIYCRNVFIFLKNKWSE